MGNSNSVYGTAQPLQGSISDLIDGQEKMDFAYRAEQRDIAKLAQEKKDKEQKRVEKWKSEIKIPEFDATGVRKVDQIQTELLLNLKGKINDIATKIVPGMPYQEEAKLRTELQMINNAPRLLKLGTESYTKEIQNIQKQLDEGKVVLTPKQMKMMEGFSQGRLSLDWNDGQIVVGMFDGEGKVSDVMPLDKLINGETFGKLIPNVNVADKFRSIGKTMGTKTNQTDVNYVKTKEKYTPKQLNEIAARNELFQQDGQFTPTAQKYLLDLGITDYDKVPKEVTDKMLLDAVDWMKSGQDTEKTVDVDYSGRTAANKEARDRADKNKTDTNTPTVSYVQQENNPSPSLADDFSFSSPYQLKDKKTGLAKDGYISGITTDKAGRIILKGEETYGKKKRTDNDGVEITEDATRKITIQDKQEVQSILGGVLGTTSYQETLKVLQNIKKQNSSAQGNNKQSQSTGKPKIDY